MTSLLVSAMGVGLPACKDDGSGGGGTDTDSGTGGDGDGSADDGDGTADDADGTADDGSDGQLPEDIEPVPGGMRRLLTTEYVRSVELMLGADAADAAQPPADLPQLGWDAIGNATLSLPTEPVEDYEVSATAVANAVIANPATLAVTVPCVTQSPGAACYADIATDLGRFAFRRQVTDAERDALVAIAEEGQAWGDGDFLTGVKYELMAILQATSFVYVTEVGEPHEASGYRLLSGNELATRMSMFLLGRTPDLALLDAAEAGALDSEDGIRDWATTMMETSEARIATENFFDEYLRLRNLESTAKDAAIFPAFTPSLAQAMRQETLLLLNDIVWQDNGSFLDVFRADYTFINAELAALYGMSPPAGPGFVQVDWPPEQGRAGVTSQGSFLSVQSGPLRTSPTIRGKFVQTMLLCNDIPPPPADVIPELPDPTAGQTLKDLLEQHMQDPACAGCHGLMDPVGFAFEAFDGIGAYRTTDNGSPVDPSGSVDGVGEWSDAADLGNVLAESPKTPICVIQNMIAGNLGFTVTPGLAPGVVDIEAGFADSGYSLTTMMVELAASPIFRFVDEPK